MPVRFLGRAITLSANATAEIKVEFKADAKITQILTHSSGRAEIVKIDIPEVPPMLDGVMELHQLRQEGNVYPLPEPLVVPKGTIISVTLKDLSGASNVVYFAFVALVA